MLPPEPMSASESAIRTTPPRDRRAAKWLFALAALLVVVELVPNLFGGYGIFIDEFYYVACSERLAAGYVDHPPLAPWLLRASRVVLGDSQLALRVLPALAGGATVWLTGRLAGRLGAGTFGQLLAGLCVATAPIPLLVFGFYSMNAFEPLLWTAVACLVVRRAQLVVERARGGDARLWLAVGAVAGLALLNKHTFVLFGGALLVGLLLTPARRELRQRWLWLGVALAALILSPNLVWQMQHDWPSLEFYRNADRLKNVPTPPLEVLIQQVLFMNPVGALVWGAGVVFFLGTKEGRPYRQLGWLFVALLVLIVAAGKSRPDRIIGAYPLVFAGGAVLWEQVSGRAGLRWVRVALPSLLILCGLAFAPISLPVLPPEMLARYAAAAGIVPQIESGAGKTGELPQWMADRFGWEEFVDRVERVVEEQLTPEERPRALILTGSYGHAGALELLGLGRDLPRIASVQNTYYLWGPGDSPAEIVITVGWSPESLAGLFEEVEQVDETSCRFCPRWRDGLPICVARKPRVPLRDVWAEHFKSYN